MWQPLLNSLSIQIKVIYFIGKPKQQTYYNLELFIPVVVVVEKDHHIPNKLQIRILKAALIDFLLATWGQRDKL